MAANSPVLSDRERSVLARAASGQKDSAIAHSLGISLGTIATYWNRIRAKYGPHNRAELVAMWVRSEGTDAIRDLEEKYRNLQAMVDSAADAILVVTPEGLIEEANEAAARMFLYSRPELTGMPIRNLVPAAHQAHHSVLMSEYWTSPIRKRMGAHVATNAVQLGGAEIPIAAVLNTFDSSHGPRVSCVIRDLRFRDHEDGHFG